jgi:hypothetical protein
MFTNPHYGQHCSVQTLEILPAHYFRLLKEHLPQACPVILISLSSLRSIPLSQETPQNPKMAL